MANLQVKGIDDELYELLRKRADSENRSISQQVIYLLKQYLSLKKGQLGAEMPANVLLDLAGSWEDPRSEEKIVADLRKARKSSRKFAKGL